MNENNESNEYLVLVDEHDSEIGKVEKFEAHMGEGVLHRAFSVFIFNDNDEVLLQQRSRKKLLWPGFWSNTCCSHPRVDETYEDAAQRRLKEEMGMIVNVKYLYKFQYKAKYMEIGSENEICAVLIGHSGDEPNLNPDEVEDCKWIKWSDLLNDIAERGEKGYTPWFLLEVEEINKKFKDQVF